MGFLEKVDTLLNPIYKSPKGSA